MQKNSTSLSRLKYQMISSRKLLQIAFIAFVGTALATIFSDEAFRTFYHVAATFVVIVFMLIMGTLLESLFLYFKATFKNEIAYLKTWITNTFDEMFALIGGFLLLICGIAVVIFILGGIFGILSFGWKNL